MIMAEVAYGEKISSPSAFLFLWRGSSPHLGGGRGAEWGGGGGAEGGDIVTVFNEGVVTRKRKPLPLTSAGSMCLRVIGTRPSLTPVFPEPVPL